MHQKKVIGFAFLLIFYLLICLFFAGSSLEKDECRYKSYAVNLTKGFYAPAETKFLWNGPGYPMFLSPFVFLKIPLVAAKYCNAFFLFGAAIFFYRTMCFYTDKRKAFWCAMLFGLYPPFFPELPRLLTESISVFLIAGFSYFLVKSIRQHKVTDMLWAVLLGAYLILTKVMYAYVVAAGLGASFILHFWRRDFLRITLIYAGCLALCLPYLMYTYTLTGKFFYWANSGGSTIYWMTNPYSNEWGDWRSEETVFNNDQYIQHRPFFESIKGKNNVEQDRLYKQKAIEQFRKYPDRYAINWISNIGRMWLNYPFSYKYQRPHTLLYMFPNALLLGGLVCSVFPMLRFFRRLPTEIIMIGLFAGLFLAGSSIVYSCSRYLVTIFPILMMQICFCWTALLKVELDCESDWG